MELRSYGVKELSQQLLNFEELRSEAKCLVWCQANRIILTCLTSLTCPKARKNQKPRNRQTPLKALAIFSPFHSFTFKGVCHLFTFSPFHPFTLSPFHLSLLFTIINGRKPPLRHDIEHRTCHLYRAISVRCRWFAPLANGTPRPPSDSICTYFVHNPS